MPIKVKVSVRQEDVIWQGTDLIVPFAVEPLGFPTLGGSFTIAAGSFTATQMAAQFKNSLITWIGQQSEYATVGPLQPADVSVLGGFQ